MTEAQCKALRGRLDVYRQVTEDVLLLVSQGILEKREARQMLGINPPDPEPAPPEPGCELCRGKVVVEMKFHTDPSPYAAFRTDYRGRKG